MNAKISAGSAGLLLLLSTATQAQTALPLDAGARRAVVEAAAKALRDRYIDPEVGKMAGMAIAAGLAAHRYDTISDPSAFAQRLTKDLETLVHDKHVYIDPPTDPANAQSARATHPVRPLSESGITRADELSDHVGYIEIFAYSPLDMFKPPIDRAMAALGHTRALIIDLRRNIGGDRASVSYLLSYFLGKAPVRIGSTTSRVPGTLTFTTQEDWIKDIPAVSYAGKPVLILTSKGTFSGGEGFAFNMHNLKLATLVGETTGGAANITNSVALADGFQISVPYARGAGPTWEGVGVKPDIATPGAEALRVALTRLNVPQASGDVDSLSQSYLFVPRSSPAPGGEAAVRRMTEELKQGQPDYARLNQVMASALRARLSALHDLFTGLGAVQSVSFVEIDPIYGDIYTMKLAHGTVYWAIALDPEGKVVMWEVRPAPV